MRNPIFQILIETQAVDLSTGTEYPIYASMHGFTAGPSDPTAPNRYYPPTIVTPLVVTFGTGTQNFGGIELSNLDGTYDSISGYSSHGQAVTIKLLLTDDPQLDHTVILFAGIVDRMLCGRKVVRILCQDPSRILDKTVRSGLFDSTLDSIETNTDLDGVVRPRGKGRVKNITPKLVNAGNLIYCMRWPYNTDVSVGRVFTNIVHAVRDGGVEITFDGNDYGDGATLLAASVASGYYATCLVESLVKLGSTPVGILTVDCTYNETQDLVTGTPKGMLASIMEELGLEESQISYSSRFTDKDYQMGWYATEPDQLSYRSLTQTLLAPILGWMQWDGAGNVRFDCDGAPDESDVKLILTDRRDLLEPDQCPLLDWDVDDEVTPLRSVLIGYGKNWTIQEGAQLLGAAQGVQTWADTWHYAEGESALSIDAIQDQVTAESAIYGAADAQTEADAQIAFRSKVRPRITVQLDMLNPYGLRLLGAAPDFSA